MDIHLDKPSDICYNVINIEHDNATPSLTHKNGLSCYIYENGSGKHHGRVWRNGVIEADRNPISPV